MDLFIGTGSLIGKLVAGEVENFKTLVLECVINLLELLILGGKAAAGGGVDNHNKLAGEIGECDIGALAGLNGEIIQIHECSSLMLNYI